MTVKPFSAVQCLMLRIFSLLLNFFFLMRRWCWYKVQRGKWSIFKIVTKAHVSSLSSVPHVFLPIILLTVIPLSFMVKANKDLVSALARQEQKQTLWNIPRVSSTTEGCFPGEWLHQSLIPSGKGDTSYSSPSHFLI